MQRCQVEVEIIATYVNPLEERMRFMGHEISVAWTCWNMGARSEVVAPSPAPRSSIRSAL